jgi:hypothetical protein
VDNGGHPRGGVLDAQGNFFAVTTGVPGNSGGPYDGGSVFEVAAGSDTITMLHLFSQDQIGAPMSLSIDSRGDLFGTTWGDQVRSDGIVFELSPVTASVTSSASTPAYGQPLTFTVAGHAADGALSPEGIATLKVDGTVVTSGVALADGRATIPLPSGYHLAAGEHNVEADVTDPNGQVSVGQMVQTVSRAHLSVVADDQTAPAGQALPGLTWHLTGFADGEDAASAGVTGAPVLSTTATPASPAGTYPITVSSAGTLAAADYDFPTLVAGTLTLTNELLTDDFDGVGLSERAVYRPATGQWYAFDPATGHGHPLNGGNPIAPPGLTGGIPAPGDYDGVGFTELGLFFPSTAQWYVYNQVTGVGHFLNGGRPYGGTDGLDVPVPGDYDGVGRTEMAVFRPGTAQWFVFNPVTGQGHPLNGGNPYGGANGLDVPAPGDYDGVGRTEMAVFRPSTAQWFAFDPVTGHGHPLNSGAPFGGTNGLDVPVPGDYDGVGRTEMAVFRPSTAQWFAFDPVTGHGHPLNGGNPYGGANGLDVPAGDAAGALVGEGSAGFARTPAQGLMSPAPVASAVIYIAPVGTDGDTTEGPRHRPA